MCIANTRILSCLVAAIILLFLATIGSKAAFGQGLLNFERFRGNWTGLGWFVFGDGRRERANCTVNVRAYGRPDRGGLDVTCSAGTYRVSGRGFDIALEGSKAAGSWELPGYGVSGVLTGRVTSRSFSVFLQPQTLLFNNYHGSLTVSVPGDCYASATALIEAPTELKRITMSLRRC